MRIYIFVFFLLLLMVPFAPHVKNYVRQVQENSIHEIRKDTSSVNNTRSLAGYGGGIQPEGFFAVHNSDRKENFCHKSNAEAGIMFDYAVTLRYAGKPQDEFDTYQNIIECFGYNADPGVQSKVVDSMLNSALLLSKQNNKHASLKIYENIITQFDGMSNPGIQESVEKAYIYYAQAIGVSVNTLPELEMSHQLIKRSILNSRAANNNEQSSYSFDNNTAINITNYH